MELPKSAVPPSKQALSKQTIILILRSVKNPIHLLLFQVEWTEFAKLQKVIQGIGAKI